MDYQEINIKAERLFVRYVENVGCYLRMRKMLDSITGRQVPPDELFMQSFEEEIKNINSTQDWSTDDWRRTFMGYFGHLRASQNRMPDWKCHPQMTKAILACLEIQPDEYREMEKTHKENKEISWGDNGF